jgi:hypothetical protein
MRALIAKLDQAPWLAAGLAVCLTVGGLALGRAPVGGDPEYLYRPIKSELGRALRSGALPFWSDRFGMGVPLVAESHAAAFYPPNWLLYGLLDVRTAYRWEMLVHYIALVAATYGYSRCLRISPWGAALAALSFTFCGFQAIHSVHEPLYTALPFLPLCLLLTDRYVATGRLGWLALLALSWGAQLTLGHFQIPMWTGGLVMVAGLWRLFVDRKPWVRGLGVVVGLAWGVAIAAVQLDLTRELWRLSGFGRSAEQLERFALPAAHWVQPALPSLFLAIPRGPIDDYWGGQLTNVGEAIFYVGTLPLILAGVGWFAPDRERRLTPWRWVVVMTWLLASLPHISSEAFRVVILAPGMGWFRAPARYTVLTSLGLAMLAGKGFDRLIPSVRFRWGIGLSIVFGAGAFVWGWIWCQRPDLRAGLGLGGLCWRFGLSAASWVLGLAAIAAWRRGKIGAWGPFTLAAIELALLYRAAPSRWEWRLPSPTQSPLLTRLASQPDVGLVFGELADMPVQAGISPAYPYLGITAPSPTYLLEHADKPPLENPQLDRWRRRFGVTHRIQLGEKVAPGRELAFSVRDPILDRLRDEIPGAPPEGRIWSVLSCPGAFPALRAVTRTHVTAEGGSLGWEELFVELSKADCQSEAWYVQGEEPREPAGPWGRAARVTAYDGRTAVVDHDGACDLIVRRPHYAGWTYRVDGGPARPVSRVDSGLQAARIDGSGTSRVTFMYEPTGLRRSGLVSAIAAILAAATAALAVRRRTLTSFQ